MLVADDLGLDVARLVEKLLDKTFTAPDGRQAVTASSTADS